MTACVTKASSRRAAERLLGQRTIRHQAHPRQVPRLRSGVRRDPELCGLRIWLAQARLKPTEKWKKARVDVWDRAFFYFACLGEARWGMQILFQGDRATSIYAYPNGFSLAAGQVGRDKPAPANSLDYFVSSGEQGRRHNHELEFGRLLTGRSEGYAPFRILST
jgi:hypothetical protein